ncbi:MAG: hypothetical protein V4510_04770 [bacterium]
MKFDLNAKDLTIELGISRETTDAREELVRVPADVGVQRVLHEMAVDTWNRIADAEDIPELDISELYPNPYPCHLPLSSSLAGRPRDLLKAQPPVVATALSDVQAIGYYFGLFTTRNGHRLIGVRRASQLKGVSKKRLFTGTHDGAKLLKGKIFAFNDVFDYLIEAGNVWILNPTGFHATADTQDAVMAAAEANATTVADRMPFVDSVPLAAFCQQHPSAARILASIRHRQDLEQTSVELLEEKLDEDEVAFVKAKGRIGPRPGSEMAFLKVLDRRRYTIQLVEGIPEHYEAAMRRQA